MPRRMNELTVLRKLEAMLKILHMYIIVKNNTVFRTRGQTIMPKYWTQPLLGIWACLLCNSGDLPLMLKHCTQTNQDLRDVAHLKDGRCLINQKLHFEATFGFGSVYEFWMPRCLLKGSCNGGEIGFMLSSCRGHTNVKHSVHLCRKSWVSI